MQRVSSREFQRNFGRFQDEALKSPLQRDADREIRARKQEIQALERLKDRKVVICGSRIVTAYPSRHSDQKRALRRGRNKGLAR